MKKATIVLFLLGICLLVSSCVPGPALVVNSSGDEPDVDLNDGECKTANNECTLRAAIMEANVSNDVSKITFDNVSTIVPNSPLPPLTADNTHIDGNTHVTLVGNASGIGLEIQESSYNIIQGLKIKHFYRGIFINSYSGIARFNKIGLLPSDPGDGTERNVLIYNYTGIAIAVQGASDNTVAGN